MSTTSKLDRLEIIKALDEALETIQWMSGSLDFSSTGQAHKGWLKMQPLIGHIHKVRDFLKSELRAPLGE